MNLLTCLLSPTWKSETLWRPKTDTETHAMYTIGTNRSVIKGFSFKMDVYAGTLIWASKFSLLTSGASHDIVDIVPILSHPCLASVL